MKMEWLVADDNFLLSIRRMLRKTVADGQQIKGVYSVNPRTKQAVIHLGQGKYEFRQFNSLELYTESGLPFVMPSHFYLAWREFLVVCLRPYWNLKWRLRKLFGKESL